MILVGNDIIDLAETPEKKHTQSKFMKRVFTASEQNFVKNHFVSQTETRLWMLWAAKETAYKLCSKLVESPTFIPRQYVITPLELKTQQGLFLAHSQHHQFDILITWNADFVHAIGTYGSTNTQKDNFDKIHYKTSQTTSQDLSKAVRIDLKAAISKYYLFSISDISIIRDVKDNRMQPPILLVKKKLSNFDISLSHHGRWIAWAFSQSQTCYRVNHAKEN